MLTLVHVIGNWADTKVLLLGLWPHCCMCTGLYKESNAMLFHLQAMGFSRSKAEEALHETGHNLEAAIEWLVANCI